MAGAQDRTNAASACKGEPLHAMHGQIGDTCFNAQPANAPHRDGRTGSPVARRIRVQASHGFRVAGSSEAGVNTKERPSMSWSGRPLRGPRKGGGDKG